MHWGAVCGFGIYKISLLMLVGSVKTHFLVGTGAPRPWPGHVVAGRMPRQEQLMRLIRLVQPGHASRRPSLWESTHTLKKGHFLEIYGILTPHQPQHMSKGASASTEQQEYQRKSPLSRDNGWMAHEG